MENFDPNKPAEGLGDLIAKLTHAFGIDKIAEKVANMAGEEDCGCDKRREQLNELFPFNNNKQEENDAERESNS